MSWKEQIKKKDKRIKTTKTMPIDVDSFVKPEKKNKYDEDQDETVAA